MPDPGSKRWIQHVHIEREIDRLRGLQLFVSGQRLHLHRFHSKPLQLLPLVPVRVRIPTCTNRLASPDSMIRANGPAWDNRLPPNSSQKSE